MIDVARLKARMPIALGDCFAIATAAAHDLGTVWEMPEPMSTRDAPDLQGEQVRCLRLRADGQRSLAMNLRETISLTRKLFELRDAAPRAR